jgi:hypothetical protein
MSESRNPRDPEPATEDPFLDAVLGLESLGRRFDALIAPPPARHGAGAPQAVLDALHFVAACDPPAESQDASTGDAVLGDAKLGDAMPGDAVLGDAMVGDALLGLVSLRRTLRLLVAALCGESDEIADSVVRPEAVWRRDLLR